MMTCVALCCAAVVRGETTPTESRLAAGTRWEMPVWEIVGESAGPTVVVVGGVHGDEPAGSLAARQIARWPIQKGRVIVIPNANQFALSAGTRRRPDASPDVADLNRNFPTADGGGQPRDDLARVLWEFIERQRPDWVLDLHEGFDFHQQNGRSVGSSIIYHPSRRAERLVPKMLAAVNGPIDDSSKQFVALSPPVDGSLARAAAEHLQVESMILETTNTQPLPLRVRQHCAMVQRLLTELDVIDGDAESLFDSAQLELASAE